MQPKAIFAGAPLRRAVPANVPVRRSVLAANAASDVAFNIGGLKTVSVLGVPVDDSGNDSGASLSLYNFTSSDPTVFTVAPDPATPGGAIITFVGDGTANLTETAMATEADGTTTESVTGVATITLTSGAAGVTVGIAFQFGTPQ